MSSENEIKALNILKNHCELLLSRYETDRELDEVLLDEQALTYNERNCIVLRSGEKKVLLETLRFWNFILLWQA